MGNDVTRKLSFARAWIYGVEVPIEQKKIHYMELQKTDENSLVQFLKEINQIHAFVELDESIY